MDTINAAFVDQSIKETRPSTKAKGFFDLPRELRDLIYQELWAGKTFGGIFIDDKIRLKYTLRFEKGGWSPPPLPGSRPRLPPWLLTSKSLLTEALSEFRCYGSVTISFLGYGRDYVYKKSSPNILLGPFRVRDMRVGPNRLFDINVWRVCPGISQVFSPHDCHIFDQLFPKLLGSPVRTLHIALKIDCSRVRDDVQHSISLYPLLGVDILNGQLDRFEIELSEDVHGTLARRSFDRSLLFEIAVLENNLDDMKLQTSRASTLRKGKQGFCWSFVFTKMHGGS